MTQAHPLAGLATQDGADAARRRFVRVLDRHANGLVRFEFAVGWPDLSCELVLPSAAFDEFCTRNTVEFVTEAADAGINALPSAEPTQP